MHRTKDPELSAVTCVYLLSLVSALSSVHAGTPTVATTQSAASYFASQISPDDLTHTEMQILELRVNNYVVQNHRLPAALSDMPLRPGHGDEDITDGWRKPIVYEPQKDGSVILRSLGGEGHTQTVQFSVIDPNDRREVSARDFTKRSMNYIEVLVHQFAAEHHRVPSRLDELPAEVAGHIELCDVDGWGQPLRYTVAPDGTVTITSDGKPGAKQKFVLQFSVPEVSKAPATKPASLWLLLPP
jgi:hypothetical protein